MKLFAYGSLMNTASLLRSAPEAKVLGAASLAGYRRVFDFKSPYRRNPQTGIYSSVLNIASDPAQTVTGLLAELSPERHAELLEREVGYEQVAILLTNGERAYAFIASGYKPYPYIFDDPMQREYLELCLKGAAEYGFTDNFLDSTFAQDKTVRELGLLA